MLVLVWRRRGRWVVGGTIGRDTCLMLVIFTKLCFRDDPKESFFIPDARKSAEHFEEAAV